VIVGGRDRVSLYYYLGVIAAMYMRPRGAAAARRPGAAGRPAERLLQAETRRSS
jgi:hypothetical protein